jgi:two-component system, NarL family, sensor histidine kinase DegS
VGISHIREHRGHRPGLGNPHLWIIVVLFAFLTIWHFTELLTGIPILGDISLPAFLGLSRHSIERFLYLLLMLYAGWTLGIVGGAIFWLSGAVAMLLRTFHVSPQLRDALLESFASLAVAALAIVLMATYQQNKRQRRKLEEARRDAELARQRYEELFDNASDAIWVHDLEGKITLANKACERLTGYPVSQLAGKNVREFLTAEAMALAREVRERLLRGDVMEHRYEQRLTKEDGSEAIMQVSTRLIVSNGKPQAFQNMARDITAERRLQDNLQFYLRQVLQAQEEERKRLARELHDDASQQILLLTHRVDNLASRAENYLPQELKEELSELYEISQRIYQGIKHYAQALRPRILDDLGLVAALKWLAQEAREFSGVEVEVAIEATPPLPPETQLVLFRIVQEALNNVQRHSGATRASVALKCHEDEVEVTITDNGTGFDLPKQLSEFARRGKLGLTGMEERARLIGGEIEVSSRKGGGTCISVRAPMRLHGMTND